MTNSDSTLVKDFSLRSRNTKISEKVNVFLNVLIVILIFTLASTLRWDVDPHHEGVIVTPSIAVASGYGIHTEVFSQYGPLHTWLNAIVSYVFGPQLLAVRALNFGYFLLSLVILFHLIRASWGSLIAKLAVISVVLAAPSFGPGIPFASWSFLPWPNLILTLFSLLCVLLFSQLVIVKSRSARTEMATAFAFGFISSLTVFLRTNIGIAFLLVTVVITLIFFQQKVIERRALLATFAGITTGIIAPLLRLAQSQGVGEYLEQTVFWPMLHYGAWARSIFTDQLVQIKSESAASFFIILIVVVLFRSTIYLSKSLKYISRFLTLVIFWFIYGLLTDYTFQQFRYSFEYFVLILCLLFVIPLFFSITQGIMLAANSKRKDVTSKICLSSVAKASLATSGILQVYPIVDHQHIWWAFPLLLVTVSESFKAFDFSVDISVIYAFILIVAFGVIGVVLDFRNNAATIRSASLAPILQGISSPQNVSFDLDKISIALDRVPASDKVLFYECPDGLLMSLNGDFNSADPAFVSWALSGREYSEKRRSNLSSEVDWIVFCTADRTNLDVFVDSTDFNIVEEVRLDRTTPTLNYDVFILEKSTK